MHEVADLRYRAFKAGETVFVTLFADGEIRAAASGLCLETAMAGAFASLAANSRGRRPQG